MIQLERAIALVIHHQRLWSVPLVSANNPAQTPRFVKHQGPRRTCTAIDLGSKPDGLNFHPA